MSIEQLVGRTLGEYQIERLLGQGQLGAVYLGQQKSGGHAVTITTFNFPAGITAQAHESFSARFAHEGAILKLAFSSDGKMLVSSADDRTLKLWDAPEMKERRMLEKQPDWTPAAVFLSPNKLAVGRLDGSIGVYDINNETAQRRGGQLDK